MSPCRPLRPRVRGQQTDRVGSSCQPGQHRAGSRCDPAAAGEPKRGSPRVHCACAAAARTVPAGRVQCQVKSPSMHRPVQSNPVQRDAVAARSWWPATGRQDRPIHSPHANRPGSHARTGPSWACGQTQTRQVRELLDRLVHVRMRNRSSIRSNAVWLPAHRAQKQFLVSTRSTMRMSCAQRSLAPGKRRYEPRKWTGKRNTRSVHPTGLLS